MIHESQMKTPLNLLTETQIKPVSINHLPISGKNRCDYLRSQKSIQGLIDKVRKNNQGNRNIKNLEDTKTLTSVGLENMSSLRKLSYSHKCKDFWLTP